MYAIRSYYGRASPEPLSRTPPAVAVARGQTQTLSSSWSSTLSCEISGDISSASLGITKSITKSYSKSDTFSGPPENSYYNCREFRVKFYENRGTYTAVLNSRFPGTSIFV